MSKLAEPAEVLAFWLAHEWGHQDLGHAANIYRPYPNQDWAYQRLPTAKEDEADRYAARFLRATGYDVEPVMAHLRALPSSPYDHTHSSGPVRAGNVARAYGGSSGEEPRPRRRVPCRHQVPCQHTGPCGHTMACGHALHAYDTVHPYDMDYYGRTFPCVHTMPCQHRQHAFDTRHAYDSLHPYDTLHEYDQE